MKLSAGSLEAHRQAHNEKYHPPQWVTPLAIPDPRLYRLFFLRADRSIVYLVGVCEGWATMHTNLRIHFVYHHMWDTIVILEEGNHPHHC